MIAEPARRLGARDRFRGLLFHPWWSRGRQDHPQIAGRAGWWHQRRREPALIETCSPHGSEPASAAPPRARFALRPRAGGAGALGASGARSDQTRCAEEAECLLRQRTRENDYASPRSSASSALRLCCFT